MSNEDYSKLTEFLKEQRISRISLTFDEISMIIDGTLPENAKTASWWYNDKRRNHAKAWLDASYQTKDVKKNFDLHQNCIVFVKVNKLNAFWDAFLSTLGIPPRMHIVATITAISIIFLGIIASIIQIHGWLSSSDSSNYLAGQRDTNLPILVIETEKIGITWGYEEEEEEETEEVTENGMVWDPKNIMFQVKNIGSGLAQSIIIQYDITTLHQWIETLQDTFPNNEYSIDMSNGFLTVTLDGNRVTYLEKSWFDISYLLPYGGNADYIRLPTPYLSLLREIFKNFHSNDEYCYPVMPVLIPIKLYFTYEDEYGKQYQEELQICTELLMYNNTESEFGFALFLLGMPYDNEEKPLYFIQPNNSPTEHKEIEGNFNIYLPFL